MLYGRVSALLTDAAPRPGAPQEAQSVDDQLDQLRRWSSQHGLEVVAELRDDGISASRYAHGKHRPDWQAAMDLILARKVDVLAVCEISRATRDRAVWSALIAACIERKVDLAVGGKIHASGLNPSSRRRRCWAADLCPFKVFAGDSWWLASCS